MEAQVLIQLLAGELPYVQSEKMKKGKKNRKKKKKNEIEIN